MATHAKDRAHYNIAVFVMLKNDKGEFLLQQRKNTSYMNGYWDSSSSGHLERGETIRQCAVREAEEECGLIVSEESLKLVQILQHDVGNWPYVDFLFVSDAYSGEVKTNDASKVANLRWFAPNKFPTNCTLAVRAFEQAGFPTREVAYSYVNEVGHEKITGKKYVQHEK